MSGLTAPIAMIVFNRPETTRRVFASVAAARPERLFLVADGPRADRVGEAERCAEVRRIMTAVDWPCRVETNFAEENMGCRSRVISGLNWVFEQVEEAIILEDDCLPDATFFPYCTELLKRYRDAEQVAYISGFNPLESDYALRTSYAFSDVVCLWGWATWRRAWRHLDEHMATWPEAKASGMLTQRFPNKRVAAYWSGVFDKMWEGRGPNTWDYQWVYECWRQKWLAAFPERNLVQNIGFGADATHTTQEDSPLALSSGSLAFPLLHPEEIEPWPGYAMQMQRFYAPSLPTRIARRLKRLMATGNLRGR